jgi:hypothetical protein
MQVFAQSICTLCKIIIIIIIIINHYHNHHMSALRKLPNLQFESGVKLYRGFGPRVNEMNDLYSPGAEVCWHQTSSATRSKDTAYRSFANGCGTLMEIVGVTDATDIRHISMFPAEGEYTILHNSCLKVRIALSCADARLLDEQHKLLPDNVDLIILEQCEPKAARCHVAR